MDQEYLLEEWRRLWGVHCPLRSRIVSRGLWDEELFDSSVTAEALMLLQRLRALAVTDPDPEDPFEENSKAISLIASTADEVAVLCNFSKHRFARCIEELSTHPQGVLKPFAHCAFLAPPRRGFVYFIKSGRGPIKIGFSIDPDHRINSLQTGNQDVLVELARIPGDIALERELHKKFSHLRRSGEWFDPGTDLLAFIGNLPGVK